jgi:hypothetical protein
MCVEPIPLYSAAATARLLLTQPGVRILAISSCSDTMRQVVAHLPDRPSITHVNKEQLSMDNASQLYVVHISCRHLRGIDAHLTIRV